jgi:hypothetical protein
MRSAGTSQQHDGDDVPEWCNAPEDAAVPRAVRAALGTVGAASEETEAEQARILLRVVANLALLLYLSSRTQVAISTGSRGHLRYSDL